MKIITGIICSLIFITHVTAQNDSSSTAKSFKKLSTDLKQYNRENFKRSGIRLYTDPEEGLFSIFKLIPEWIIEFFSKPEDVSKEKIGEPFLVIAHRGSPCKEIENTIPSFKRALDDGANALEMDVSITKDKKAVIWHDWSPNELKALLRENGTEPDVMYKPHPPENDLRKKISELTFEEWKNNYTFKKSGTDSIIKDPQLASLEDIFKWGSKENRIKYIFFDVKAPSD